MPMAALAITCLFVGLFPQPLVAAVSPAGAAVLGGADRSALAGALAGAHVRAIGIANLACWSAILLGAAGALALGRRRAAAAATWGCGYASPNTRMQYTGRAFSETLSARLIPSPFQPRVSLAAPEGLFPTRSQLASECRDPLTRGFYEPFLARWADRFAKLRWMQQGVLHVYLVYILAALVVGLGWSSFMSWGGR
jgi:hypothetical protein